MKPEMRGHSTRVITETVKYIVKVTGEFNIALTEFNSSISNQGKRDTAVRIVDIADRAAVHAHTIACVTNGVKPMSTLADEAFTASNAAADALSTLMNNQNDDEAAQSMIESATGSLVAAVTVIAAVNVFHLAPLTQHPYNHTGKQND